MIENELKKIINSIPHSNPKYQAAIMERWNHLAKPIGGLGRLEEMVGHTIWRPQENLSSSVTENTIRSIPLNRMRRITGAAGTA